MKRLAFVVALLLAPAPAFADGFFSVGVGTSVGSFLGASQRTFPWQIGFVPKSGWVGAVGEYTHMNTPGAEPNRRVVGGSLIVGKRSKGWRPFGSVGWASLGEVRKFSDTFKISGDSTISNTLITFGGGLFADLSKHIGLLVDIRVYRDMKQATGVTRVQFTRASGSVYVSF